MTDAKNRTSVSRRVAINKHKREGISIPSNLGLIFFRIDRSYIDVLLSDNNSLDVLLGSSSEDNRNSELVSRQPPISMLIRRVPVPRRLLWRRQMSGCKEKKIERNVCIRARCAVRTQPTTRNLLCRPFFSGDRRLGKEWYDISVLCSPVRSVCVKYLVGVQIQSSDNYPQLTRFICWTSVHQIVLSMSIANN